MDPRKVFAYSPLDGSYSLYVWRCPACGSTGLCDSWCEGHSAPVGTGAKSLRVKREPVLVPHAEPERSTTELVYRET